MTVPDRHTRWLLDVSFEAEDALSEWLLARGATAMYREADPPHTFFVYFLPGAALPDPEGLGALGARLRAAEGFEDEDWLAKSREGFGCLEVGRGFFIQPLWETGPAPAGRIPVVVNPGLAFGTGGHETTRLCMSMLEDLAAEGLPGPILDIGAGTGILALTAWLLGGRDIAAFDIDPDCGPAMAELLEMNAALLHGERPFRAFVGTLEDPSVQGPYGLLVANILLETIQELLPRMAELAQPGGLLLASGILAERQDEALVSLSLAGFSPLKVAQEGAWVAILARRGGTARAKRAGRSPLPGHRHP
jgi:ribosomal protein L11 methyltransferase